VRAITREDGGKLAFDGNGPVLDWVVEMERFDQTTLFCLFAESGGLTHRLLEDLIQQIVTFHRDAEPVCEFGGSAGVEEVIGINDRSLRAAGLTEVSIDQLIDLSRQALARIHSLLDRRRSEGKVRRCHGNLHLGNICLVGGRATLFDGIEFSDSIACIDTLYDLAFLLMDLCQRGMTGEANLVLNRYLDLSEEAEGIAALPLFLSLRAAVRAHVTALTGTEAAVAKAKAYLAFALTVLKLVRPQLVAIGGLSGTGKSTIAAAIAPQIGACPGARVLRSDVLQKQRAGKAPTERLGSEFYTAEASTSLY
jgi:aminoglycoside phosphotransferase family enzyme